MKRPVLFAAFNLALSSFLYAQTNTFPTTGNVGIGTLSPTSLLDVRGNLIVGNGTTGQVSTLTIKGPNTPFGTSSYQEIKYGFASAGSTRIRSYRGGSWDTYLQFWTTPSTAAGDNPLLSMHLDANGNIGIGNTIPPAKLSVSSNSYTAGTYSEITLDNLGTTNFYGSSIRNIYTQSSPFALDPRLAFLVQNTGTVAYANLVERMTILGSGNIGMGTNSPQANLHVTSSTNLNSTPIFKLTSSDNHALLFSPSFAASNFNGIVQSGDQALIFTGGSAGTGSFCIAPWALTSSGLRIDADGDVSIGTNDSKNYKLAVNGSAVFTKAVVKLNANWPDYVFDPEYELPTIQSIESYLKKYKHLPEMPSSHEIESEGIDLGNNQILLLKKIEELTLFIIHQNKILEQQQILFKKMQDQINNQKTEMDILKQKIK